MADYNQDRLYQTHAGAEAAGIDQGLRSYMLGVYNHMTLGLVITGIAAFLTLQMAFSGGALTAFGQAIYLSPLKWVVMLSPLAFVFAISFGINRLSANTARLLFFTYAAVMGLSLSSIFLIYTNESIVRVFFITAIAFGGLSLYGYTTKRDLSAMGTFLMMGLFGLIIAMVVNIFLQSSAMQFAISVVGVLVFAGLTAWDTQSIKEMYYAGDGRETALKKSVMGALRLYLDFINMFMMLLSLLGNRE